MNIEELKTVATIGKSARHKWKGGEGCGYGKPKNGDNYGILTGKINNIMVIDCDFYKTTKTDYQVLQIFNEYKNNMLNTYTVKTPRGGLHYYFKYDEDIKTTSNDKYNIDIRSEGAYIIGEGSKINISVKNECKKYETYKIIHNVKPATIPEDVKKWLLSNLYTAKIKREQHEKETKTTTKKNNNILCSYNLNDEDFKNILNNLDDIYWSNDGFLKFTTFCKYFNKYDEWDNINKTKPNYNKLQNNKYYWDTCKIDRCDIYSIIDSVLKNGGNGTNIYTSYCKYRPIIKNIIKPDQTIKQNYLSDDLINAEYNYMIKSDTGTGKTTLFKKYIKNSNSLFISIVSRVSLADEQYRVFLNNGIDNIKHYNIDNMRDINNYNIIVQLDSIIKLGRLDFSKYIIFLDEINSIIEHLILSPTLNNKRAVILTIFIKLLKEAKQIIGTDADISDITLTFLKAYMNYTYIKNTTKHNKGVNAIEINNFNSFIEQLKKENKYIVACDSAAIAETIYTELNKNLILDIGNIDNKNIIKLITAETTNNNINLDEHNKIIFSPKILYGLDSLIKRPVYCYYKEHTINPTAYVQQISRCRNITNLYYTFEHKAYTPIRTTRRDLLINLTDENTIINNLYELEVLLSIKDYKHFLKHYTDYAYNNICYKSNKFSHFLKLIHDRGFILNNHKFIETNKKEKADKNKKVKEMKKLKLDNFNINDHKAVNSYLKLPITDNKITDLYKEYYINDRLLTQHKNIIKTNTLNNEQIKGKIEESKDTRNNIIHSNDHKILLLKRIKSEYNINDFKNIKIIDEDYKNVPQSKNDLLYEDYIRTFQIKTRGDFDTVDNINKCILTMYKALYGKIIKKTKHSERIKETNKIKTSYNYLFDDEFYKFNVDLYEYRKVKNLFKNRN